MANTLNEVELLEQRIEALDNAAFATLRDWFVEFEQSRLNRRMKPIKQNENRML